MDAQRLQDRISRGLGLAARKVGLLFTVYRPDGVGKPVTPLTRRLELHASFTPSGSDEERAATYGQALWRGTFDASYTQPGDYLVGQDSTYFVASQMPAAPVQCVLTNRVVSLVRPMPAMQGGYSGFFATPGQPVISVWPASLLEGGGHAGSRMNETRFGGWTLLLPPLSVSPQIADVVNDDLGGVYTVGTAEQSSLGWRLLVRQISA